MPAWVRGLLAALVVLFLASALRVTQGLDRALTDAHWRWRAAGEHAPFPPDIVVVGIDDRSVKEKGRLKYWSRKSYADLLDRLRLARAVGFDILFTEPDDRDPAGDAALVAAVRRHRRVVLPWFDWKEQPPVTNQSQAAVKSLLARLPPAGSGGGPSANQQLIQPPLPGLVAACAALGYPEVDSDPDGVYRTPTMLKTSLDGTPLPQFMLSLAAVASGTPLPTAIREAPARLHFGERSVPLAEGRLYLRPLVRPAGFGAASAGGPGQPVSTVSFVDALKAPPETFRDKVVLVGETATGTSDIRANPFSPTLRGVELNAEILANLLHEPPTLPSPLAATVGLTLLGVGLPLWLYSSLSPRAATVVSFGVLVVLAAVMEAMFWGARLIPDWSPVVLGLLTATLVMGLLRLAEEEAQKQKIRARFSQYVAPEVVEDIVTDPDRAPEDGRRQRVAVLFSDVRGFTTYSEQNPAELVVRQMREYLDEMTLSVHAHHGVLDKFIGDAVMALFGPFLEGEVNLSAVSVACALDMLTRLEALNKRWTEQGMPPLRIGIGIHVGEAIVGNIGTENRQQFTALGDTVNLAARLESSTKDLNAVLLVSEAVGNEAEAPLRHLAEFHDRGEITVKGREQTVLVYDVRLRARPAGEEEHVP